MFLPSCRSRTACSSRDPAEEWPDGAAEPAELAGWRRRWSQARDNRRCEKTFARDGDGWIPDYVLGLNVERTGNPRDVVNGLLITLTPDELDRLDVRELRYDRVDVSAEILPRATAGGYERVFTYEAKPWPPFGLSFDPALGPEARARREALDGSSWPKAVMNDTGYFRFRIARQPVGGTALR